MSETPVPYDATAPQEHPPSKIIISDYHLRNGFTQLPNAFLRRRNLSLTAKMLYQLLLSYGWRDGSCHPGYEALCEDMGITYKTYAKALEELKSKGIVSVKRMGLGRKDQITINPLMESEDDPPDVRVQNVKNDGSAIGDTPTLTGNSATSELEEFQPSIGDAPTLIRKTSLRNTSLRNTHGEVGGGGSDFDFHERIKTVASIFGITDPKEYAAVQRKVVAAEQEAAQLGVPLDTVEQARDCELWYSSRKRVVKSWPLTYGAWLNRTLHPEQRNGKKSPPAVPDQQASWGCTITDKDRERAARSERLFLERQAAAQAEEASRAAAR